MTTDHQLIAKDVTLGYGDRTVIEGLDVELPAGKITVIVGSNGCGKSTLLKSMARLLTPQSGHVLLDGKDIHSMPTKEVARVLGLLAQSPIARRGSSSPTSWVAGATRTRGCSPAGPRRMTAPSPRRSW